MVIFARYVFSFINWYSQKLVVYLLKNIKTRHKQTSEQISTQLQPQEIVYKQWKCSKYLPRLYTIEWWKTL